MTSLLLWLLFVNACAFAAAFSIWSFKTWLNRAVRMVLFILCVANVYLLVKL